VYVCIYHLVVVFMYSVASTKVQIQTRKLKPARHIVPSAKTFPKKRKKVTPLQPILIIGVSNF